MNKRQEKIFRYILLAFAAVIAGCIIYHITTVTRENKATHISKGLQESDKTYADVHFRGGETSSWYKMDADLYGKVYDCALYNTMPYQINSWNLRIDIKGDCYLNQFWNGEVEIHQHVASGKEKSQKLNLASYNDEDIILDHTYDASDLLIELEKGDYIVYHPSVTLKEVPMDAYSELVVGFIVYYADDVDVSDYTLSYKYKVAMTDGPMFRVIFIMLIAWILCVGVYLSAIIAYKNAQKDMNLRKSGIAYMAEVYNAIYIIDLVKDEIIPVGVDEEADQLRPKNLTAKEQVNHLFNTDAEEDYKDLTQVFANLDTIADRLVKRSSIAIEYRSKTYGWCKVRFIAMDRTEGKRVEKVLFTLRQINEEKREIDDILERMEQEKLAGLEKRNYLENIFREAKEPLQSILTLNERIGKSTGEETVLDCSREIRRTGETFLALVDSTMDYTMLVSGKRNIRSEDYSLREFVKEVEQILQPGMERKGIEYKVNIAPNLPDSLSGDKQRLREALTGLLYRITGAADSGSIELRIFGKTVGEDRIHLLFSVQEKGSGIGDLTDDFGVQTVQGILKVMGSVLKTADLGEGRDYFFEIDQMLWTNGLTDTDREGGLN